MARRRYKALPGLDALSLLRGHDKVLELFQNFERLRLDDDDEPDGDIVSQACHELVAYGAPEGELFQPAPAGPPAHWRWDTAAAGNAGARAATIDMQRLAGHPHGRGLDHSVTHTAPNT